MKPIRLVTLRAPSRRRPGAFTSWLAWIAAALVMQGCAQVQRAATQIAERPAPVASPMPMPMPMPVPGAAGNLLVNGSFEEPVVRDGAYVLVNTGQSFPGWLVIGAPGAVAPISARYTSAGIVFASQHGQQWLDMTGLSNAATGIQQAVRTEPGAQYELSFHVGNVVGGGYGTASAVEVLVDGRSLGVFRNDGHTPRLQHWRQASLTVTATGATTVIAFINRDGRGDNSNGLDNVSFRRVR